MIVFGVPSFNEADSIGAVTKVIDEGLTKYFKNHKSVIVNADNDSPDNTKGAFLQTPTQHKKIYISAKGKQGKGHNIRAVYEYAKENGALAVGFIDGDVKSAKPEWVKNLIEPVLNGYDHVLPIYLRNKYDGAITNHLVYPLLYGLLNTNIRQPLSGEIGVSPKAFNLFLSKPWHQTSYQFGVDIFMVTESIFNDLRLAQTFIGIKDHKPSAPQLGSMFFEVMDSFSQQLSLYKNQWKKEDFPGKEVSLLEKPSQSLHPPELEFDYKKMKEEILKKYSEEREGIMKFFSPFKEKLDEIFIKDKELDITPELWVKIVYSAISEISENGKPLSKNNLESFGILFMARFLTFYKEVIAKTHKDSEKEIIKQAKLFRSLRHLAIK